MELMKRVRTPRVIQMEAVECGAASLSIILRYYGKYLPLEELRLACGVSRDGSNAFNIIKAAEKYGLIGAGFRASTEMLREYKAPCILLWEYRHFLVLEGFKGKKIFLNDPGSGQHWMWKKDFNLHYSGIALTFEKGPEFQPGGKEPSFIKQIATRLKSVPVGLSHIFLTSLCLLIPGFAMPAFLMVFLTTYFSQRTKTLGGGFLGAVLLTAVASGALIWMRQFFF